MRVVSLLPSATEIVLALTGASALDGSRSVHLVGRSHECDYPIGIGLERVPVLTAARTSFTSAADVDRAVRDHLAAGSSLYAHDTQALATLKPDLIITQDLCEVCSIDLKTVRAAAAAMNPHPKIVSLNPQTFEGVLEDIATVGRALGLDRRAAEYIVQLRERVYRAEEYVNPYTAKPAVAFLEWTDPLFIGGHWTPQLIERAGGAHPLNPTTAGEESGAAAGPVGQTYRRAGKSIRVPDEVLAATRPDVLIICPCGLTLDQACCETQLLARKPWWNTLPAVQRNRVGVVDGSQMFNRPGPRLVDAFEFLVGFLNGRESLIADGFPWRRFGATSHPSSAVP